MFWQSMILIDQRSANSSLNYIVVKKKDEISQTKGQCRYDLHGGHAYDEVQYGARDFIISCFIHPAKLI
jgi:hypothetical protein